MKQFYRIYILFLLIFSLSGCQIAVWDKTPAPITPIETVEEEASESQLNEEELAAPILPQEDDLAAAVSDKNSPSKADPVVEKEAPDTPTEKVKEESELAIETMDKAPVKKKAKLKKKKSYKKADYPIGIIGQVEPVVIYPLNEAFSARIDTGATTSSLDARNIEYFERNGKKWVRFEVHSEKRIHELEFPVIRIVGITQHEGDYNLRRPVVRLTISMGDRILKREFSLANRSEFDYPVLIGRNVLLGEAMVDVSKKNTLKIEIKNEQSKNQ